MASGLGGFDDLRRRVVDGGNAAQPAALIVLVGLDDLVAGVHHERPEPRDGLTDWTAPEEQHLELRRAALLPGAGRRAGGIRWGLRDARRRAAPAVPPDARPLDCHRPPSAAARFARRPAPPPGPPRQPAARPPPPRPLAPAG